MNKLLEIRDLTIAYDDATNAVDDISMDVQQGEIIGIVGESGSGKTTLIRSLINLLPKSAKVQNGTIHFKGKELLHFSHEQWQKLRGNDMAMVFQNPGSYLNPILRVGTQIIESIRVHRSVTHGEAKDKALITLEKMHLKDPERILKSYPFQLSGGMQQRVAIAKAMVMEPDLILADEPTSALDVKTQGQIIHEMAKLRQDYNTSIIMVTHNICSAANLADKIMVMHQGKMVEFGATSDVVSNPKEAYTRNLIGSIPQLNAHKPFAVS